MAVKGLDDAYEDRGTVRLGQSSVTIGRSVFAGLRFLNVTIPAGAHITSAVLSIRPTGRVEDPITIVYRGQLSVQTPVFTNTANNLTTRAKTATGVVDTPPGWVPGENAPSPNLASVVEEIIRQPGWQSGNPLVLFIQDQGSPGSRRILIAESGSSNAASLRISYQ